MLQGVAAAILARRSGFGHRGPASRRGPTDDQAIPSGPRCEQPEGRDCRAAAGPWRSPTFARLARPSGAAPPGARPAPGRPPQPAGPLPPAPPPGREPLPESSTTTRHPPGCPARRRGLAGSAWRSAHPRCCPSPSACSQPLPPAGLDRTGRIPAGVAVLCPTDVPMAADPAAAVGVGGWTASQASTAAIASVCSWSRRRPASPPSSCTSMVNPGGPGRGRRGRPRPWPAAASRAAGVDPEGLGWGMPDSLLANGCWRRRPSSTAGGSGGSVAPESRSCLDHAEQDIRASKPPTSVQHRRPASAESAKRRGVAHAAPPRPGESAVWVPARHLASSGRSAHPGSRAPLQPGRLPP